MTHDIMPNNLITMDNSNMFTPFIEPKVIKQGGGKKNRIECCLSRPNQNGIWKKRYKWIIIEYSITYRGDRAKRKFSGFEARVVQHELDHLKGILI